MEKIKELLTKINSNTLIKQSIITLILRVFGVITLFGFTLFLTHNYSPKIVGQYDFTRTFLLLVGSIALLGTDQSVLFFAGKLRALNSFSVLKKLYINNLKILFMTSLCLLLLFLLVDKNFVDSFFNDSSTYNIIYKCIFLLFFNVLTLYNTEFIRALGDVYLSELFRNTFKYFPVFIGSILLTFHGNPECLIDFFIYGFFFLAIITLIIILIKLVKIEGEHLDFCNEVNQVKIIKSSYSMGLSSLIFFLLLSVDVFLLKRHFGDAVVAYYSLAIKLMTFMSMVIISFGINASTKIAELYELKKVEELTVVIKRSNRLIFIINFIGGVILILFSETILKIFGADYILADSALKLLVLSQIIASFFGVIPMYMNMTNKQIVFKRIMFLALLINIILNIILIPKYEMLGAAISFSITNIFWILLCVFYVFIKDKIKMGIF
ncbi:lipopolysaccharide biosynthesis protein [Flavobacterium sp. N501239]|uniref:lipopolysaccharide biosynthesis protein n=1 Tax=Flavobacterium sp. N501239 TaxID=2986836 RepID=UPI002224789B|nr:MATE family efflux transporter [Flavobacterium sp. N501239]